MRKKIEIIDKPSLTMHIEYDHMTVGELGNILMRLQAAIRSVAGLSPGEYDGRYSKEQPRFIASSVQTGSSIDIITLLAILSIAMAVPGAVYSWQRFGAGIFQRFKAALHAMIENRRQGSNDDIKIEGLKVTVKRGDINFQTSRASLNELTPKQRGALANFLWSLTGPAKKVDISDEDSEISIEWPDEDNDVDRQR